MTPLKNYFAMSLEQLQLTIKYCTNVLFFNKVINYSSFTSKKNFTIL